MNGMPLTVLARNLGHASTKMLEAHYSHLTSNFVTNQVQLAAPRFDVEAGNVRPLK
jgi:hypothetical protein